MEKYRLTVATPFVFLALLLNLWVSTPTSAQGPSALPPEKIAKLEAAISSHRSRLSIPGISVAIVVDNQLRWQGGYGTADLENFVPAKPLTVYRIASVTKALTAVAVMQLVEKGKIDLDAPVQTYAPTFPVKTFPITTRTKSPTS